MEIDIQRAGLSTSIQDMGRTGWAACGVPESGVMDRYSAGMANLLLGNDENAAVLEMTMTGVKVQFTDHHAITLGGVSVKASLNGREIACFDPVRVKNKDVLDVQHIDKGNFAYLAINGGFQSEKILNAQSMYAGITPQKKLKKGEVLSAPVLKKRNFQKNAEVSFRSGRYDQKILKVYPGPEFGRLSNNNRKQLAEQSYMITPDSNRMAFMLKEKLQPQDISMLTSPVLPGTIQLTSGGNLMILMRDAQVSGGYPRILQVAEKDLDILSQKKPGEQIRFYLTSFS